MIATSARSSPTCLQGFFKTGVFVSDIHKAEEYFKTKGIAIRHPVFQDKETATSSFILEDPNGNLLQFMQQENAKPANELLFFRLDATRKETQEFQLFRAWRGAGRIPGQPTVRLHETSIHDPIAIQLQLFREVPQFEP